jgi:hypothetical protein
MSIRCEKDGPHGDTRREEVVLLEEEDGQDIPSEPGSKPKHL